MDEAGLDEAGLRRKVPGFGRFEVFFVEDVFETDFLPRFEAGFLSRFFATAFFARFFGPPDVLVFAFFARFLPARRLAAIDSLRSRAPR